MRQTWQRTNPTFHRRVHACNPGFTPGYVARASARDPKDGKI